MTSGRFRLSGVLLQDQAPETCNWFLGRLPLAATMLQAAWSGMAVFSDLDGEGRGVPFENITSYPAVGSVLMYPGNMQGNAGELYIPYGGNRFSCPIGQIAGNHFLTFDAGVEKLSELGRLIRQCGARDLHFALARQDGQQRPVAKPADDIRGSI
ncbi:DUF3830 family protein (plasmid) [Paracoccus pantotrophus]|uniref:DUF3830 family protein n=2 Tax=Paracoccaceae TaxID=31989 RepID=A0A7H9C0U6_PARPN|nr:DUF3830 family protein [Paracoccus pantotrophus]